MNVHEMNDGKQPGEDTYKSLLLLDEMSKGEPLSQRDLSRKLNIALGLVNSYVRNLVAKGYVTVASAPAKKYAYFLTPKGFAEKTRLTYQHLQNFTKLYKEARRDFRDLFGRLHKTGVHTVVFAGVDEVAEIAYLTLQETDLKLVAVIDDQAAGRTFFKLSVIPIDEIHGIKYNGIVISSFWKRDAIGKLLVSRGVSRERIYGI